MRAAVTRLDPKNDLVFKLLFTREPALLLDMLEAILARPIRDVSVLNPGIPGERPRDKHVVLDIRVALDDGSRADVEMQVRLVSALVSRLVYYGTRDYGAQLRRGEGYDQLTPTLTIAWLVDPLFPDIDRLHSIFELRERHTHVLFGDQLQFHVLQLSALSSGGYAEPRVERWARFLMADDAELDRLASEDPIMALAKHTLDQLSQDPETRRLAREREEALAVYRMTLAASRAEGKAEVLLTLLGLRFGLIPVETRARVARANLRQLDAWIPRVLTAATLDEVLAA
jgi:predicted transposase/invertase (TIGR01784 family)